MSNAIVGTWRAVAREATLGVTPRRPLKPGQIADLVIREGGTGYAIKKKLFGENRETLIWKQVDSAGYIIELPEAGLVLAAICMGSELITKWNSSLKSIDGMGIFYQRA